MRLSDWRKRTGKLEVKLRLVDLNCGLSVYLCLLKRNAGDLPVSIR